MSDQSGLLALQTALRKSEDWHAQSVSLIDGQNIPFTPRAKLAISFYHLCIQHYSGIYILTSYGVHSSSFALFRSQFEAYIRGSWLAVCSDEDLQKFINGKQPPFIGPMIEQLETHEAYKEKILGQIKDRYWSIMNDFTHGGMAQVMARQTPNGVTQNYDLDDVARLLDSSATISLLAGVGIGTIAETESLSLKLYEVYKAIYI